MWQELEEDKQWKGSWVIPKDLFVKIWKRCKVLKTGAEIGWHATKLLQEIGEHEFFFFVRTDVQITEKRKDGR